MKLLDPSFLDMDRLVTRDVVTTLSRTVRNRLNSLISGALPKPPPGSGRGWDPRDVWEYLDDCRRITENYLHQEVKGYSGYRWLWYLRRLPRFVFEGRVSTTYGYDTSLSTIITGQSGLAIEQLPNLDNQITFPINDSVVRRVVSLAAGVRYLSQIHVLMRIAAKNVQLGFPSGDPMPAYYPSQDEKAAIRLYDERVASQGDHPVLGRLGTIGSIDDPPADGWHSAVMGVFLSAEDEWVPAPVGSLNTEHLEVEVLGRFLPRFMSLRDLRDLTCDPRASPTQWWTPANTALLVLLSIGPSLLNNLDYAYFSLIRYGYFLIGEAVLVGWLEAVLPQILPLVQPLVPGVALPQTPAEMICLLEAQQGSVWPVLRGPILRRVSGGFCVDWHSATHALMDVEFPVGDGPAANARAEHFEREVQAAIDRSPWSPSANERQMVRRTLRLNGLQLTDIDAIGANGGTLLLVSCRSIIYTGQYDAGMYSPVRNALTTVLEKVEHWERILALLRANPGGDNYDFSRFRDLIGVACTPQPIYVPLGKATEFVAPGLRAAPCFSELVTWLQSQP